MTNIYTNGIQIFGCVPDGCILHLQNDGRHAPHLRGGEWAVVDTEDREVEFGDLYLIQQNSGPVIWQVNLEPDWLRQSRGQPERPCVVLQPLNRPDSWAEIEETIAVTPPFGMLPLYMSDGPLFAEHLRERVIGKVIGIYEAKGGAA